MPAGPALPTKGAQAKQQIETEAAAAAGTSRGLQAAQQRAATAAAAAADAEEEAPVPPRPVRSSSGKSRRRAAAAELMMQHFVPTVSDEFPEFAAVADAIAAGDLAAETSARMLGLLPPRMGGDLCELAAGYSSEGGSEPRAATQRRQRLRQRSHSFNGNMLLPSFDQGRGSMGGSSAEEAAAEALGVSRSRSSGRGHGQRRKSIAAVKLEQDMELRACEEAAMVQHR